MGNGSSNTNRHGIPTLGGTANRCCWPGCPFGADRAVKVPLCKGHARHVHAAYEALGRAEEEAAAAANAERAAAERARNGVIYYAKIGGHIKIGWTSQLDKRMRSYPPNSELLAVHPGSRSDEKQLHRRFAVHRSHGAEWYPLMPVILDHIDQMTAKYGPPPAMIFGAKPVDVHRRPKDKPTLRAKYAPTLHG